MKRKPAELSDTDRHLSGLPPGQLPPGADPPTPPGDLPDAEIPITAEAFTKVVNKGVARAVSLATTPAELVAVIKAATDWYEARYGVEDADFLDVITEGVLAEFANTSTDDVLDRLLHLLSTSDFPY